MGSEAIDVQSDGLSHQLFDFFWAVTGGHTAGKVRSEC